MSKSLPPEIAAQKQRLRQMSLSALLFALIIVLSALESLLPPPPVPAPVRYGLANIPLLYAVYFCPTGLVYALTCGKAFFALLSRGGLAAVISLTASLSSVSLMLLLRKLGRERISLFFLSALAAIVHNFTQLAVVNLLYQGLGYASFVVLAPLLLVFGLLAGVFTALSLRSLLALLPSQAS